MARAGAKGMKEVKTMKLEVQDGLIRGLPLAILVTLLIQGGAAVWWVSAKARDSVFIEQRVERLENAAAHYGESHSQTIERLARIEERMGAQTALLERIEKQLVRKESEK